MIIKWLYFGGHISTAALTAGLGFWAVSRSEMRGRGWFGAWMSILTVWSMVRATSILVPNYTGQLYLFAFDNAVAGFSALLTAWYGAAYTGRNPLSNRVTQLFGIAVIPLTVSSMTAPFHGWHWLSIRVVETPFPHVYETYGPGMALLVLYAVAAILTMVYYFVELYAQSRHSSGVGVLVLAGSILVGASLLILTQLEVLFVPTYEHTPFGISVLAVGTGYAAIRLQFYDVAPIARDRVIKYLKDPFVALDAQQQIVDYNSAFTTIVEDFDENSIGQPLAEVFPKLADQLELSGNEQFTAKMQMNHEGQQRYYDIRGGPIFGLNDEVDGYLIVLRDITALKERERELNLQNERLDRFASVVSHDLRNPLAIAKTYLDFARETCETDDLDTVEESLDRMDAMIGDLLTMARAETSVDDTESIDLAAVAEDAWSTAQTDGATFSNEFDETTIEGDRSLIQNVFENLFRNAVDHNDLPITVRVGLLDGSGFYVEDDGKGIAPDQRGDVLEFGHTTSESGTGFGLAIVRELIEAHGWEISVTESATSGARFEIYTGDQ